MLPAGCGVQVRCCGPPVQVGVAVVGRCGCVSLGRAVSPPTCATSFQDMPSGLCMPLALNAALISALVALFPLRWSPGEGSVVADCALSCCCCWYVLLVVGSASRCGGPEYGCPAEFVVT